jgi:membrane protease YdiL (CAAX protease family)
MNFWARRRVGVNLAGAGLLLLLWISLAMLVAGAVPLAGSIWSERLPYATLLIAIVVITKFYDRMPLAWSGLGLHRWTLRELLLGLGLGVGMSLVAWLATLPVATVSPGDIGRYGAFASSVAFILAGAIGEELLFRGYLFQRGIELIGVTAMTLLGSLLFALAHLGNPSVSGVALANIWLAGIFFSLCYIRTGSLWLPIGAHAAWNLAVGKLFGMPVSGLGFGGSLLFTAAEGPAILTGGAFGPEGGLAATLALALGIVALVRIPAITYSPYVHATVFRAFYRKGLPS